MRRFHLFCVWMIFLGANSSLNAFQYEVSGRLDVTHTRFPDHKQQFEFTVSVATPKWRIRMVPTYYKPAGGITPDYWEAASDGTNFFSVRSLETYAATAKPAPGVIAPAAFAHQGIGPVPFGVDRFISTLWYTYASHDYWKDKNDGRVIPPDIFADAIFKTNNITVQASWKLESRPPYLPTQLVASNYFMPDLNTVLRTLPPTETTTNFHLQVKEFHEFYKLHLPRFAEVIYNTVIPNSTPHETNQFTVLSSFRATITAQSFATNLSIKSFVPRLPPQSMLTDYSRLTNSPAQITSAVRDHWFDASELKGRYDKLSTRPDPSLTGVHLTSVELSSSTGAVQISKSTSGPWTDLKKDAPLIPPFAIKTGENAYAVFTLAGKSRIRIPGTSVVLIDKVKDDDHDSEISLSVSEGRVLCVAKLSKSWSKFEVDTPVGVAGARGNVTCFEATADGIFRCDSGTLVAVYITKHLYEVPVVGSAEQICPARFPEPFKKERMPDEVSAKLGKELAPLRSEAGL